ncbi:MAG TPA: outer membrane protein assembly factor BamD [Syntrophobacteria bacterium]|nr:outer membrane protein assembly factor BamD [Syntrophobacteria bacterium]
MRRVRSRFPFWLILWVTTFLGGCGWFQHERVKSPEELASQGMEEFEAKDYRDAIKTFSALKERYPYSRYAILAELKLADAYFHDERYPEAISAYEDFARLHPKNEAIPYVLHQVGDCHYHQLLTIDRDQTATRQAILAFERLLKSQPNCPFEEDARKKIRSCRQRLAEHEVYVARFYYKSKHYRAALVRFEKLLNGYEDVLEPGGRQEIEALVVACREQLARRGGEESNADQVPRAPLPGGIGDTM